MVATLIHLTDGNRQKLNELSRRTGKTQDELLNEAVERLPAEPDLRPACADWKAAWRQAAGMWKDRDDIPELMAQLKRELNRVEPPDEPL